MAEVGRRLLVHGRVQGVFYRGWTERAARRLGLRGWVRNRRDGSVELLVRGDETAVARLIEMCREGPPAALVERIDVEHADEEAPPGFETRPTV